MTVVMCMGGRSGYGPGCGQVRRASKAELAGIRREGWDSSTPSDCPECGEYRQFENMTEGEFFREVNG